MKKKIPNQNKQKLQNKTNKNITNKNKPKAQTSTTTTAGSEQLAAMKQVPHTSGRHSPTSDLYPSIGQIPPQVDRPVPHRHLSPHVKLQIPRSLTLQALAQPLCV